MKKRDKDLDLKSAGGDTAEVRIPTGAQSKEKPPIGWFFILEIKCVPYRNVSGFAYKATLINHRFSSA